VTWTSIKRDYQTVKILRLKDNYWPTFVTKRRRRRRRRRNMEFFGGCEV
jgi:hypothetical protein